jgi:hypothetical protein
MKKLLFSVATLLSFLGWAQSDTLNIDGDHQQFIDSLFAHVDKSVITSGYLLDNQFGLIAPEDFYEIDTDQSEITVPAHTPFSFIAAEGLFNNMHINSSEERNLFAQRLILDHADKSIESVVHIGAVFMQYHQLRTDPSELEQTLSFSDWKYYDLADRPFTPFEEKYTFIASTALIESDSRTVSFQLDSDDFSSNLNQDELSIEIDFDDGLGYRSVLTDQIYSVNYNDFGSKQIKYKLSYNETSYLTSSAVLIENPLSYSSGAVSDIISAIEGYDDVADDSLKVTYQGVGATAYIEYGCGHDKLIQPLILVNGFDFANQFDYEYIYLELNAAGLKEPLESNQMDLVFIDFDQGSGDMYTNAELTKEVIRQVNALKAENNSFYENVVMGFSMGGVLGRMALREMELDGEDHQTKDYISYDSPHQGANVPLAVQYLIKDLGGDVEEGLNNSISGINETHTVLSLMLGFYTTEAFINLISGGSFELFIISPIGIPLDEDMQAQLLNLAQMSQSPAAKQLLIYQTHESNTTNYTHDAYQAEEHISFVNYLDNLGYPENCRKTAISNGNGNGDLTIGIDPGDQLFQMKVDKTINGIDANFDLWGETLPYSSGSFKKFYHVRVFGHKQIWSFFGSAATITLTLYNRYAFVKNSQPFDTAPGGLFLMPESDFSADAFDDAFTDQGYTIDVPTVFQNKFSFIPIVSSLGLDQMNNVNYSFGSTDISSSGTAESPFDIISTFENYSLFSNLHNQQHVDFSSEHAAKINDVILPTNVNYPSLAMPYLAQKLNFGKGETTVTRSYIYPFPVLNNGTLCVNCDDRIGFSNITTNEQAIDHSHFNVETSIGCDFEGQQMEIQSGGRIEIGDGANRTGNFIIRKWSTVRAKTGSTIIVRKGSKLIVDDGAQLIIEDGVDIILEDDSSVMEFHGKEALEITDNASFSFTGSGNLYFDKAWDPDYPMSIVLGENAKIDLEGSSENDLVLKTGKNFAIGGNHSNEFKIWHAKVEIDPGSNMSVSTPIDWRHNKFECASLWGHYKSVVLWGQEHFIRHTDFIRGGEGANEAALQVHSLDQALKLLFCDFIDCKTGLRVKGEQVSVSHCDFENCNQAIVAKAMEGLSNIRYTDIYHCNIGIDFSGQSGSELLVKESEVLNGDIGILVQDTRFNMECTEIDQMNYDGLIVSTSDLILNSPGKNTISNCQHGISFFYLNNLFISNGYNTFSGNTIDIEGNLINYTNLSTDFEYIYTGQSGPNDIPNHYSLNMANNIVNNDFPAIVNANVAVGSLIDDIYPIRPIHYEDNPTIPECGLQPGTSHHIAELNFTSLDIATTKSIHTFYFNGESMYQAAQEATSYMSYRDHDGQNTIALSMLADILHHLPDNMEKNDQILADFLYRKMLEAIAYIYTEHEVERNPATANAILNETLNQAIEVIDDKLAELSPAIAEETQQMSRLLMDKAQLFRTAGHYDYASFILNQSSNWENIQMLSKADYWSCIVAAEEALVLGEIKFEEFMEASNLCQQNLDNARIVGRNKIDNSAFLENFENHSDFVLSPSVSSDVIRLSVLNTHYNSKLTLRVTDALGKIVSTKHLRGLECSWDVSQWKKGAYFIEISTDKQQLETLKMLVI